MTFLMIGNVKDNKDTRDFIALYSLTGVLFVAFVLLAARLLFLPALNQRTLSSLFFDHADTRASGVFKTEYTALAEAISEYLAGNRDTAEIEVIKGGSLQPAFHERELEHLKDVKNLADLSKLLRNLAISLTALVFLLLLINKNLRNLRPGRLAKSVQIAAAAVLTFILMTAIYTSVDFGHAFTMLHQLVFQNDLWQLDPQTDLMIQLMPQSFFGAYAKKALLDILALFLFILIAATGTRAVASRRSR